MTEIERALSALNCLDAGCPRDEWVRVGMAAKSAGLTFDNFHNWSKYGENYSNEKDCKAAWKSFKKSGGVTEKTLFCMAITHGWRDPQKKHGNALNLNRSVIGRQNVKASQKPSNAVTSPRALAVWGRCLPATPAHEYILRKQGMPDGLRYYPASASPLVIRGINVTDYLVVPCWSNQELQTLQFIPPDKGDKLNLSSASFNDGYFTVGEPTDLIYLNEGIGQAWAVYQASGAASVVSFGSSRMMTVANALRNKYPRLRLVIMPDRGKEAQAAEIAAAVNGQWVELPQDKPSNYDANDYAQEYGHDELAHLLECVKAPKMRYTLLLGSDLCNAPPMRWLVQGVLPAEGLAALYGASGSGKSFLTLDLGCAIASGNVSWFGRDTTQAAVTYICLEGEAGIGKRVKAWSLHYQRPVPDTLRFITQSFNLISDDISKLAQAVIATHGAGGLTIIDTLNRAAPGADENSSVDMGNIIAVAKKLQSLIGGLVLLVHHTGKDATKGLRGHSSLYAALDGAIEVTKTDTRLEWNVAKSKDDVTGNVHPFGLKIMLLGVDDKGKEITSCVVTPNENIDNVKRRILPPKSGNQKIIWGALGALFSASTHNGQGGAPAGTPCIRLEEAIAKTRGHLIVEEKRRTERTQAAISGLVARGLLEHKEGWIWAV